MASKMQLNLIDRQRAGGQNRGQPTCCDTASVRCLSSSAPCMSLSAASCASLCDALTAASCKSPFFTDELRILVDERSAAVFPHACREIKCGRESEQPVGGAEEGERKGACKCLGCISTPKRRFGASVCVCARVLP